MEKEIPESFKKWYRKHFKENYDKIDIHAEYDRSLKVSENQNIFMDKFKAWYIESETEEKQKAMAMDEKRKADLQEELKKEERELIEKWKNEKVEAVNIKSFEICADHIKMACQGQVDGAIIVGEAGLGKSFMTINTVKESGREWVYYNTYLTPLALYKNLYRNNGKIIILDDVCGIDTHDCTAILKGALDDKDIRIVTWGSTTSKLEECPERFQLTGQIIILTNTWRETVGTRAIGSRIKPYYLKFSYPEKVAIMKEIVKKPYKSLSLSEREYCLNKLLELTSVTTKDFNFRMLINAYKYYGYDKTKFDVLVERLVDVDEEMYVIKKLMESTISIPKQIEIYCKRFGKSRATYFNKKKELMEKSKSLTENNHNFIDEQIRALGMEV